MSLMYLVGTEIDYVEGLHGAGFKFHNPNVKSTCGCGSSFRSSRRPWSSQVSGRTSARMCAGPFHSAPAASSSRACSGVTAKAGSVRGVGIGFPLAVRCV